MYGQVAQSEGQVGGESSRDGGDDKRLGKVQCGLQIVDYYSSSQRGSVLVSKCCLQSSACAIFAIKSQKEKSHYA